MSMWVKGERREIAACVDGGADRYTGHICRDLSGQYSWLHHYNNKRGKAMTIQLPLENNPVLVPILQITYIIFIYTYTQ